MLTAVTRILSIAEVFFKGLTLVFTAPIALNPLRNFKFGLHEIFVHTPKNILRTITTPLEFIGGVFSILIEPKLFVIEMHECMKINVIHAQRNSIGSNEHYNDLAFVDGIANQKFIDYQKT